MNPDPERKKETQRFDRYDADKDFDRMIHGSLAAIIITAGAVALILWGCG